jgi:hypothetical protein
MNMTTFRSWLGQVTTGIGVLIGAPVVIALLTSQITLDQAIPGIVAAVIGLIWPENKQLAASAQTAASDFEVLIPQLLTLYRAGLQHGAQPPVPPAPTPAPIPAAPPAAPAAPQAA